MKVISQYNTPNESQNYQTMKKQAEVSTAIQIDEKKYTEEAIIQAIQKIDNTYDINQHEHQFSYHKGSNQIMIKLVDRNTKEAVAEYPSEKILDMVAKMCELAGIYVDEKR